MLLSLAACGAMDGSEETETVEFTDDAGRTVTLPAEISRIAPSGSIATMILTAAAADKLTCRSSDFDPGQADYLPDALDPLPVVGQIFGGKGTLNMEALLASDPQIIIDCGEAKPGLAEDLDALSAQTGLPVIFLATDLPNMEDAFRTLGTLLGEEERCNALADFVDKTLAMAEENAALITDPVSIMYTTGETGLDTNARGSTQAQVIEIIGAENAIVVEDIVHKNGGNTIGMEQLYHFDPEVIICAPSVPVEKLMADATWQELTAVQNEQMFSIPSDPYNFVSNPPSMNMLLGVYWLGNLAYPELYDYDMAEVVQEFYSLFWNCHLSYEDAAAILKG
ncbi:MAG: ABC transporter substrate-binding protein [Oscillospiraceae bacterium]|nr:ABC transporter substrate-binding protein [Oscillospiraceae bacterium]